MPRQLSRRRGECLSRSCRDRTSLGQSTGGHASSLAPRAPGKRRWAELTGGGQCIFRSRPSVPANGNWRPLRRGESLFIGRAVACLSVISEKLKLDSRVQICFHDIFPLDFSKCILGVSQRLFFKNKSHILFFQTSFIFDI